MAQATNTSPTGIRWALLPGRRPITAVMTNPASGRSAMSGIRRSSIRTRSLAHPVVLVDERGALVAVDRDDDRESDGCLGRGNGHDHERDHGSRAPKARHERPERDDREVDRVQHQLDRHQHADRIAPGEEPEHPDREEQPGEDEVGVQRVRTARRQGDEPQEDDEDDCEERPDEDSDHRCCSGSRSRLARNTPPMTAASSRTPTISNGRTQLANRTSASSWVTVSTRAWRPPQSVATIASTITIPSRTADKAAGIAWVWKTSRVGADFVSVSMIANRMRTLIAPMYTSTWAAATSGAPTITYIPAKTTKRASPQGIVVNGIVSPIATRLAQPCPACAPEPCEWSSPCPLPPWPLP